MSLALSDLSDRLRGFFSQPVCAQEACNSGAPGTALRAAAMGATALALAGCSQQLDSGPSHVQWKETVTPQAVAVTLIDRKADRLCAGEVAVADRHMTSSVICQPLSGAPEAEQIAAEGRVRGSGRLDASASYKDGRFAVIYDLPEATRLTGLATVYDIDAGRICTQMSVKVGSHMNTFTTYQKIGNVSVPIVHNVPVDDHETMQNCTPLREASADERAEVLRLAGLQGSKEVIAKTRRALGSGGPS